MSSELIAEIFLPPFGGRRWVIIIPGVRFHRCRPRTFGLAENVQAQPLARNLDTSEERLSVPHKSRSLV